MEVTYKEYLISDDKSRLDPEVVISFLSRSYWANKRPEERTRKALKNSICIGVYTEGKQVGFARIVTDMATIYYICDVFVLEEHRGKGIGKKMIETIVNSEDYEWMTGLLGTLDAHGLYEQYGFVRELKSYMKRIPQRRGYYTNQS